MTDSAQIQKLIGAVEQANSPAQLVAAVRDLAAAQAEEGIPILIAVLGYNNPAAAVIAVKGLIQLGGTAVLPLIEQLDEYNYGARAYAIRALATIADPRALDVLITAATDFAPSVRRAAAKGLGTLQWSLLGEPQRYQAQDQAQKTLLSISQDPDWSIRYAAVVGLEAFLTVPDLAQMSQTRFEEMIKVDPDLAVRARVQRAQTATTDLQIKTG